MIVPGGCRYELFNMLEKTCQTIWGKIGYRYPFFYLVSKWIPDGFRFSIQFNIYCRPICMPGNSDKAIQNMIPALTELTVWWGRKRLNQ